MRVAVVPLLVGIGVAAQDPVSGVSPGEPTASTPANRSAAVRAGLEWLKAAQREDGSWSRAPAVDASPGDVGTTAIAALAFLRDGNTLRSGPHRDVVLRAIDWLRRQQDPDTGRIGASTVSFQDHVFAADAIVEACGLSRYKVLQKPAARALDYIGSRCGIADGWRASGAAADDPMTLGWIAFTAREAARFGPPIEARTRDAIAARIAAGIGGRSFALGYLGGQRGVGSHGLDERAWLALASHAALADGEHEPDRAVIDAVVARPPITPGGQLEHPEYWYCATLLVNELAPTRWDAWSSCLDELVEAQRDDGSWARQTEDQSRCGAAHTTGLAIQALQSKYRYVVIGR